MRIKPILLLVNNFQINVFFYFKTELQRQQNFFAHDTTSYSVSLVKQESKKSLSKAL